MLIHHRRRREKKTDYKKRLDLLKSKKIRLVIRRTLKNIIVQFMDYKNNGDTVIVSAVSQELRKHGWKLPTGNIPASYLTGFLAGTKAKSKIKEAILDLGLQTNTKGSRIFAALKGVIDAGIGIRHSPEIFPSDNRIIGSHISDYSKQLGEEAKKRFSMYFKAGIEPMELTKHFEDVKKNIEKVK